MASLFEKAFAEAVETGRGNIDRLVALKREDTDREKRELDRQTLADELNAARKQKAEQDAKRTAAARKKIKPLRAELEEKRERVTDTRATLDAAQKAYNEALAEAKATHRQILGIAWNLWPGDTIPRDYDGNPTADIFSQFGYVVVDGESITVLRDEPSIWA